MRHIETGKVAFTSLVLLTNCKKSHRIIHQNGHTFLCNESGVHPSCKAMGIEFPLKRWKTLFTVIYYIYVIIRNMFWNDNSYICDPLIPIDQEALTSECLNFLTSWGSRGSVESGSRDWILNSKVNDPHYRKDNEVVESSIGDDSDDESSICDDESSSCDDIPPRKVISTVLKSQGKCCV